MFDEENVRINFFREISHYFYREFSQYFFKKFLQFFVKFLQVFAKFAIFFAKQIDAKFWNKKTKIFAFFVSERNAKMKLNGREMCEIFSKRFFIFAENPNR